VWSSEILETPGIGALECQTMRHPASFPIDGNKDGPFQQALASSHCDITGDEGSEHPKSLFF